MVTLKYPLENMATSTACTTVTFKLATRLAGRELILTLTFHYKYFLKNIW